MVHGETSIGESPRGGGIPDCRIFNPLLPSLVIPTNHRGNLIPSIFLAEIRRGETGEPRGCREGAARVRPLLVFSRLLLNLLRRGGGAATATPESCLLSLSLSFSRVNNNIPAGKESRRRSPREALLATKFLITAAGRDRSRPAGQLSEAIRNPRESRVNNLLRIIVYGFPRYGIRGGAGAALGNVSSFPAGGSSPPPLPPPRPARYQPSVVTTSGLLGETPKVRAAEILREFRRGLKMMDSSGHRATPNGRNSPISPLLAPDDTRHRARCA